MSYNEDKNIITEQKKLKFSDFKEFFSIKFAMIYGICSIVGYCFSIGYYPIGLNISDTTNIIFYGIGFAIIYLLPLVIIMGIVCIYYDKPFKSINPVNHIISTLGVVFIISIYGVWYNFNLDIFIGIFFQLILTITMCAIFKFLITHSDYFITDNNIDSIILIYKIILVIFIFIPLLGSPLATISIFKNIATMINFSKQQISIVVNDSDLATFKNITSTTPTPILYSCFDNEKNVIHNINLLWHGIGTHSVVEIPKINGTLILKSEEIKIIKNNFEKGCLTFTLDKLADNTTELASDISQKINEHNIRKYIAILQNEGFQIDKIEITGFAEARDIQSTKYNFNDSYSLSIYRAYVAAYSLQDSILETSSANHAAKINQTELNAFLTKSTVGKYEIKGNGRKFATEKCEYLKNKQGKLDKKYLNNPKFSYEIEHCFAPDRKVEIKLYFTKA